MKIVEVVDYDPVWPALFDSECRLLHDALGHVVVAIDHVGSTAVPGLAAKPIIDILMEVTDLEAFDSVDQHMMSIGYTPKGEFGIPGRRYFQKGGDARTHHLHAFQSGDFNLIRHLAFRDYLRAHPDAARQYSELKRAVAAACGNDLGRYCDGKDAYVKRLETIAVKENSAKLVDQPAEQQAISTAGQSARRA